MALSSGRHDNHTIIMQFHTEKSQISNHSARLSKGSIVDLHDKTDFDVDFR
mgnify:CR=1 FL=1